MLIAEVESKFSAAEDALPELRHADANLLDALEQIIQDDERSLRWTDIRLAE